MKRRALVAASLVLFTMTGCGSSQTLTCTKNSSDNGFTNKNEKVFSFKDDRITKLVETNSITAEGENSKYLEDYKKSSQTTIDGFKSVNGIEGTITEENNKLTLTIEYDASKMSEDSKDTYRLGENYDSTKVIMAEDGYTCK